MDGERARAEHACLLAEYLADRNVLCPLCGYNLRGLTSERCPECGESLRLQVGLLEPRLGAYIALLTADCLGFGASAFFVIFALALGAPPNWWAEPAALLLLAQFSVTGILLVVILASRRRFRRASTSAQRLLALVMWGALLASATGVIVLFDR